MNADLEQGLKAYFVARFVAADVDIGEGEHQVTIKGATVEGGLVSFHANTDDDTLPPSTSWVVVGVGTVKRIAHGLHTVPVLISVSTPHDVAGFTVEHHRELVKQVRACFPDMPMLYSAVANAAPEDLAAAEAARDAGLACLALLAEKLLERASVSLSTTSAWFMHAGQQSVAENRWRHLIEITLAVQELPA
jgi:hypothetical protein